MILHYMSASRIKKYLQCAESYHQSYEMGVKGTQVHLVFGNVMHSVFERWYQEETPIEDIYEQEWTKADIIDPEFYQDGYSIISHFLSMNSKERYVPMGFEYAFAIDILTGEVYDTDEVDWTNEVERKAFMKMLEDKESPIIFGYIDRIEYDQDEDILRIVDYKTSRMAITQQEADGDVQLSMYLLVAKYLYPDFRKVVAELQYVRLGDHVRTSRTDEELETFRKWLISLYHKIREDKVHKSTLNRYCGWCDSKAGCVAYKELINGEAEEFSLDGMDADSLDEQLEKVAIHIKILDGRKKEIETKFKDELKKNDNQGIKMASGERYLTSNARVNYDIKTIVELFPDDYMDLLSPKKGDIDKLAGKNPDIISALERTSNKHFIEPTLRKKKK